jgi:pyruvate dehydrogenase E1 component alpha subunit
MSVVASFTIEYQQLLDPEGRRIEPELPAFARDRETMTDVYRQMSYTRSFDSKAVALQRTGKLGTYASCLGHEATHIGVASAMQYDDVMAVSYREIGAMLLRGVKPREILLYWGGDERGSDWSGPPHDYPICVPISTQCLHAAGAALAFKLRGEPRVAVAFCGDGGSSKSDFYAALNSAGAYQLPLVLVVVNNQWAISVPRSAQTGAQTLAQKGLAGGLDCVQVDGNDLIAVRAATEHAIARARNGHGGSVIEAVTYRLSDHTTADDARRYRDEAEVKAAWENEPMRRLRAYLAAQGWWDDSDEMAWKEACAQRVDEEVNAYLATEPPPLSDMFDYIYAEPPLDLVQQRAEVSAGSAR